MSRKRFEEFAISVGMRTDKDYDGYIHADTAGGWTIWQNEVTRLENRNDKLRARIAELEKEKAGLAELVPTNWLDPLLTGEDAALPPGHSYGCNDVERLLRAVKSRIQSAIDNARGEEG